MLSVSRLLCLVGRHRRSRGHARRSSTGFRSRCKRCGVAMAKTDGGKWIVDKTIADAPTGLVTPPLEPAVLVPEMGTPEADPAPAAPPARRLWPFGRKRHDRAA